MSKARLHLILCSDDIGPEANHRRRDDHSFQPYVIDGGKRMVEVSVDNPWLDLFYLLDLSLLASQASYLAFLGASLAVLEPEGRAD